eukprot:2098739-Karenia_brevis.AAC.1
MGHELVAFDTVICSQETKHAHSFIPSYHIAELTIKTIFRPHPDIRFASGTLYKVPKQVPHFGHGLSGVALMSANWSEI